MSGFVMMMPELNKSRAMVGVGYRKNGKGVLLKGALIALGVTTPHASVDLYVDKERRRVGFAVHPKGKFTITADGSIRQLGKMLAAVGMRHGDILPLVECDLLPVTHMIEVPKYEL